MHYVGIDLAWGQRAPTGVAVLDPEARLLHVSAQRTDDEVAAAVEGVVAGGPCLVAIDAPLIVRNATGNRGCEAALNKDFARFDAGAHPANTGKPEFAETPRGARIAGQLRLDLNPRSGRQRRAIEVYPHPATVALFRLGRSLKYKNKAGRDLEGLRSELLALMGYLETVVVTAGEPWTRLRADVEGATRKSELRVVEDQVDAVVCAYVGLFADLHPDATTTYLGPEGSWENGYVVVPTLPDDLEPSPRRSRPRTDPVQAATQAYAARLPQLRDAGERYVRLVQSLLDEAGINYLSVTGRTKSVGSFAAKAARSVDGRPGSRPLYRDPLTEVTDQLGVRVITYVQRDVETVADLVRDQLVVHDDRDMGRETASEGRFGYSSRHQVVGLDGAREGDPEWSSLRGLVASVQIRTVLQHAWAEFEHDIRYKGVVPEEHERDFDRRFTLAAGLLELADREFSTIRDRLQATDPRAGDDEVAEPDADPRLDPRELAAFLAGQYADAGWSRTDHYAWISGLLLELGVTSLGELSEALVAVDEADINQRMDYRYPPGAVRRLDDALLASYAESYVELHGNAHRVDLLRARLAKLRD
ncbi:GTP pyrophosphokinase YjbM [Nocardioides dokdonensis FR1436]|uniref:GTP pyrophosphokinase YjbM n=1 Tax=Nocardioides dokdonensis FR1436 TaxID=1300347 RepID=A0A1A9GHE2_9ACTN|nr:DUF429 domain-containing protein [Nocardioides dokdonensis]ANH37664.1 GTP pyrophosphokinase YjbM [Nocardioides dokdonensis FR1436]